MAAICMIKMGQLLNPIRGHPHEDLDQRAGSVFKLTYPGYIQQLRHKGITLNNCLGVYNLKKA